MKQDELNELLEGFTVGQLIQTLSKHDPELPVVFAYPSGDYWGRVIAAQPTKVYEGDVKWSDYHRSLAPEKDDPFEEEEDEAEYYKPTRKVVLLEG